MFSTEQLQQDLTAAFSDLGYVFQIVQQVPIVEIYLNYPDAEHSPSSEDVAAKVEEAIASLDWGEIEQVYLVGRQLGKTDPEWDIQLKIDSGSIEDFNLETSDSIETPANKLEESLPPSKAEPVNSTPPNEDIEQAEDKAEEASRPSIETASAPIEAPEDSPVNEISPDDTSNHPASSKISDYCFIRNKQLINSEIVPPPEDLAQLIADFDQLPDEKKHEILPQLKEFFTGKGEVSSEQEDLQGWIENLENLPKNYKRKASIWLSRYCANHESTMETINTVLNPPTLEPEQPPAAPTHSTDGITHAPPGGPPHLAPQRRQNFQPPDPQEVQVEEIKPQQHNFLIPIIGLILTIILVSMDVMGRYSPQQYANLCKESPASIEICQVSGQLLGLQEFESRIAEGQEIDTETDEILDSDTLSGSEKAKAIFQSYEYEETHLSFGLCQGQAYINSGYTLKEMIDGDIEESEEFGDNLSIERVLPGIYNYQVEVPHKETKETVITSCTMTGTPQEMAYVKGDRMPEGWPENPYSPQKTAIGFFLSNIQLNFLSSISLYTLFSGVGIFLAVLCGLAIRIQNMNALYQAALVLGFVQYFLSLLPALGIFSIFFQPAILSMVLGLASIPIKGLDIDWSAGYRLVGSSLIVVILTRRLLSYLLLFTLFQLFA